MHTVAVLSLKGGVGKTTVALGLASAAVYRGARTLVADLDPQGNATASLDSPMAEHTLDDVIRQQATLSTAITASPWGEQLDVLTGSGELELLNEPTEAAEQATSLAHALTEATGTDESASGTGGYELGVLDCPPSLGLLTRSALLAADSALLVCEPTMYAIAGAQRALDAIEQIRAERNTDLRPAGVLINRFRSRSYEHQFRIDELREEFGSLVMPTAIPDRLVLQQAQGACVPIHRWNSPAAEDLALTFNMVLAKILRSDRAGRHRIAGLQAHPHGAEGEHEEHLSDEHDLA